MRKFAIYGASGFGREVAPLAKAACARSGSPAGSEDVVFVSDIHGTIGHVINGMKVLSFEDLISSGHRDREVVVALADWRTRREVVARCESEGLRFASLTAHSHVSYDDVVAGEGAIFCEYSMCTSNVRIGRHFHCNIYSYVAHDCVVGDFVTLAPKVCCNGRVIIEDDVYVGTGVVIKNGGPDRPLVIGKGAIIGMGAVVLANVAAGSIMVGNPAKPMEKRG